MKPISNNKFIKDSIWTFDDDFQDIIIGGISRVNNDPKEWALCKRTAKTRIQTDLIRSKITGDFKVVRDDKDYYGICCPNTAAHRCPFKISFKWINNNSDASSLLGSNTVLSAKVITCILNHTCSLSSDFISDSEEDIGEETKKTGKKRRSKKLKLIAAANKDSMLYNIVTGDSDYKSARTVLRQLENSGQDLHESYIPAQQSIQKVMGKNTAKNYSFDEYLLDLMYIRHYIENVRLCDPEGIYEIITTNGEFPLMKGGGDLTGTGTTTTTLSCEYLDAVVVIPSFAKQLWKHSSKIASADATHLRGRIGGVANTISIKDSNNSNITLMYTISAVENKKYWDITMKKAFEHLFENEVIICFYLSIIIYFFYSFFHFFLAFF